MENDEKCQYYSVYNGSYYAKRTSDDRFFILDSFGEWVYYPSLLKEFYDVLSGYIEISKEEMDNYISEKKSMKM